MFYHKIYSRGSNFVQFELSYQVATERCMANNDVETPVVLSEQKQS